MKKHRGYSLVELSITLVVIGVLATVALNYFKLSNQKVNEQYDQALLRPLHQAIEGYVYAHHHLPCPAADSNGVADCTLTKGFIPHQDLMITQNIRNTSGLTLRYAVHGGGLAKSTGALMSDLNFPFIAQGTPTLGYPRPLGNNNGLDMCQAIVNARSSSFNSNYVYLSDGVNQLNVAYIILDPGHGDSDNDGNLLDGLNAVNNFEFQKPSSVATVDYDDYVSPMYFNVLWDRLGCVHSESPAGHAHPNVASAASIMLQSITDYKTLLEFAEDIADANVAVAATTILAGAASIGTSVGGPLTGTSKSITTAGVMAPSLALAASAVVAAAATTAVAIATEVKAVDNQEVAKQQVIDAGNLISDITTINATVYQHVLDADAAGL
jgi:prepilin-type N-terminal cleavage/methylation domain-containing protein